MELREPDLPSSRNAHALSVGQILLHRDDEMIIGSIAGATVPIEVVA